MTTPFESARTRGVQVQVQSFYVPEQSDRSGHRFFFSYHIRIRNDGDRPVQLLNRHWVITDGNGRVEEVRGPGVIGQQPRIAPGDEFEYESFCPLPTPTGMMRGSYQMLIGEMEVGSAGSDLRADGQSARTPEIFEVEIPQFFLIEPNHFH